VTSPLKPETVDPEKARDDLLDKFEAAQSDLKDAKAYYDAERRPDAIGIAVPPNMRDLLAHVGYPRLYIDSIAERQELEGFRLGGADEADEELWDWWQANNLDVEAPLGHTDALIYGASYITVSMPDPSIDLYSDPTVPIIMVEPPTSLFAEVDPRTKLVSQAIRAVYNEDQSEIVAATYYGLEQNVQWVKQDGDWAPISTVNHGLELVPVIPLRNRTKASDLYGSSEITPELRSITDAAARILMDMQATAEIMAIPQRLLFGVRPDQIGIDPDTGQKLFDAYVARILAFEDHEAKAQQFTAAELRNFTEALDALDRKAAAYTGLPPQYLSYNSQNPASAEAIKSSEARLVKKTERKNLIFGGAWEQAMRVAYKAAHGGDIPPDYLRMETIWRDPSTPTYAAKADAASKLFANGMGVIPKERARIDMGYSIAERLEMRKWDEQESAALQLAGMLNPQTPIPGGPADPKAAQDDSASGNASKPTKTTSQSPTT
jgi:hypothetical protein